MEILREECKRRGVDTSDMPDRVFAAARWAARVISERGLEESCSMCGRQVRTVIWCATCDESFCMACLKLRGKDLWDLNFE